jgi:hypothetical protein
MYFVSHTQVNRSLEASNYKGGIYYPKEAITPVDVVFSAVANYSLWGGPILYFDHACWVSEAFIVLSGEMALAALYPLYFVELKYGFGWGYIVFFIIYF